MSDLLVGRVVAAPAPTPPSPSGRAPSQRFGDLVAAARHETPAALAPRSPSPDPAAAGAPSSAAAPALSEIGRQLLGRVSRGERQVERIVHQALAGRAFTPADLLAVQAQVYRYTQELDLVSRLVERASSTVKTVMQQGG